MRQNERDGHPPVCKNRSNGFACFWSANFGAFRRFLGCGGEKKQRGALPVIDSLIAATAMEHGFTLVTREYEGFQRSGNLSFNPWNSP